MSILVFSTTSSMRAGWMRPSARSLRMAWRATSRRMGSKLLTTMVSGVSSTIRSQPVAFSRARMLRPSRPMMRPLRSSLGSCTELTAASLTTSEARRWMAETMVQRAFFWASSAASSSMRRTSLEASMRAVYSSWLTSSSLASSRERPAMSSSLRACSSARRLASAWRAASFSCSSLTRSVLASTSFCFWSTWVSFLSRLSSLLWRRCSCFSRVCIRSLASRSASWRACRACSLALSSASLRRASASRWPRLMTFPASFSASASRRSRSAFSSASALAVALDTSTTAAWAFLIWKKKPTAAATARARKT